MKILDIYIYRRFFLFFIVINICLISIIIIIDISQKITRLNTNGSNVLEAILYYYPLWAIWIFNKFLPICVFITMIIFISILNLNRELISIMANGISFGRFLNFFLLISIFFVIISILLNFFITPSLNYRKNNYKNLYMTSNKDRKKNTIKDIVYKLSENEILYIKDFNTFNKVGGVFLYQVFNDRKLNFQIISKKCFYNDLKFNLFNCNIKQNINNDFKDFFLSKYLLSKKIDISNVISNYSVENFTIIELYNLINNNSAISKDTLDSYKMEFYSRINIPFSIIIFSLLAVFISTRSNVSIGRNLLIGIIISFIYIIFVEYINKFSFNSNFFLFFISILPNLIVGVTLVILYIRRIRYI